MSAPLDLHAAQFRYALRLKAEQCKICGRTEGVDRYEPTLDLGEVVVRGETHIRCPEHAKTPMPPIPDGGCKSP